MDILVQFAEGFIGIFNKGGATFMGLVTGIIPTLVVLLTFVNAIIKLVGEERVMNFAKLMTKNIILRYTVFPVLAVFFLTNPIVSSYIDLLNAVVTTLLLFLLNRKSLTQRARNTPTTT